MRNKAAALCVALATVAACATATAIRRGYEIHTADMTCEEANRYVQAALGDMGMRITEFRKARPGVEGFARAERDDGFGGTVRVRCDDAGVHIVSDQSGFSTGREFERGLFLSITGRAGLVVEREGRYSTGVLRKRELHAEAAGTAAGSVSDARPAGVRPASGGGVEVRLELLTGFSTVLDFEANVAAAGIMPVRVVVTNRSDRTYDFDPQDLLLRERGSRRRAQPLSPSEAVERLLEKNREVLAAGGSQDSGSAGAATASELGDVEAASRIIRERALRAARLAPGDTLSGYLYFETGDYDRARVTMIDVATGETEGFIVEF